MLIIRDRCYAMRDKRRRAYYKKYELKKIVLKSLLSKSDFSIFWKLYFQSVFQSFPINSSISRYKNYCMGHDTHGKPVYKIFKLSRHQCKDLASYGYLPGLRKSSF